MDQSARVDIVPAGITAPMRRVTAAVLDELAGDPADRRYDELQLLGGEMRGVVGDVVRTVRAAQDAVPALPVCREVLGLAREVLAEAQADEAALAALDVEPDVEDLVTVCARLEVAGRLLAVGVRDTAAATGLTPGYISELRGAKKGLPSADAAMRIDEQVPVPTGGRALLETVRDAKSEVTELRARRRARRGGTRAPGIVIPHDLRAKDRLDSVADVLRTDETLLHAVATLVALPPREQRAVARLITELNTA